jgi:hypothetical protein
MEWSAVDGVAIVIIAAVAVVSRLSSSSFSQVKSSQVEARQGQARLVCKVKTNFFVWNGPALLAARLGLRSIRSCAAVSDVG